MGVPCVIYLVICEFLRFGVVNNCIICHLDSQMASSGLRLASSYPQLSPDGLQLLPDGLELPQAAPSWLQLVSRWSPAGSKLSRQAPSNEASPGFCNDVLSNRSGPDGVAVCDFQQSEVVRSDAPWGLPGDSLGASTPQDPGLEIDDSVVDFRACLSRRT